MLKQMVNDLWKPAYQFLISALGVALALVAYEVEKGALIAVGIVVVVFSVGWGLLRVGKGQLPEKPETGRKLMEWWLLAPGALGAGAAALVIGVAIELAVPDGTAADTKTLITSATTAITAFITAGFITTATEEPDSTVGEVFKSALAAAYKDRWSSKWPDSKSQVAQWATRTNADGVTGWSAAARKYRAKQIQEALTPGS